MKILNLTLTNLNSLKGSWHIDFTDPAFDDGIFAIVGKTGAGKTTILDAICLAIYGRTPRLKISKSHNDLMSLDTGECLAQVEIEMRGKFYRFRWEQVRAGKKPNGKLQDTKRQISKLTHPYDDDGEILESKSLLLCDTLAVEILGMKFEQFTRSVMLAQGDFNAFLKAESGEKSQILEQITGTDIYSKISAKVYEVHRQKELALDTLQAQLTNINTLTDDELSTLTAQIATQNNTLHTQKTHMAQLDDDLTYHQECLRLGADIHDLAQILSSQNTLIAPTTPKLSLQALSTNVRHLQKLSSDIDNARQRHQQLSEQTYTQLSQKINNANQKITDTHTQIQKHQQQLANVSLPDWVSPPALFEMLTTLGTQSTTLAHLLDGIRKQHGQLSDTQDKITQKLKEHKSAKTALNDICAQKHQLTQQLIAHFGLNPNITLTAETFENIEHALTLTSQHHQYQNTLHDSQTQLATLDNAIHTKQTTLDTHTTVINQLCEQITPCEQLIVSLEQNLALTHELSALKKHFEALVEGTPCPVCGSTTHPSKHKPSPFDDTHRTRIESELHQHKTRLNELNHTLKQHEIDVSSLQSDLHHLHKDKQIHTQNIDKINTEITAIHERLHRSTAQLGMDIASLATLHHLADYEDFLNKNPSQYGVFKSEFQQLLSQENDFQQQLNIITNDGKTLRDAQKSHQAHLDTLIHQCIDEQHRTHQLIHQNSLTQLFSPQIMSIYSHDDVVMDEEFVHTFLVHGDHDVNEFANIINELQTLKTQLDQHQATQHALNQLLTDLNHHQTYKQELDHEFAILQEQIQQLDSQMAELNKHYHNQFSTIVHSWLDDVPNPNEPIINIIAHQNRTLTQNLENLNNQKRTLQADIDILLQEIGKNTQIQTNHEHAKHTQTALLTQIDTTKNELATWSKLNKLIGSQDGKKYRVFAQGLTLDLLLHHANQALATMNERYILCTDNLDEKTALQIHVIDTVQGGEMRSTKNLSGGESFIISLALAIGLSMMNSDKVTIDSLFLDEGFGTLDEETLDIALATLSTLHTNGKMIGIISHVSSLKEQISTQIIVKKGLHGKSTLSGAGVRNPQNF